MIESAWLSLAVCHNWFWGSHSWHDWIFGSHCLTAFRSLTRLIVWLSQSDMTWVFGFPSWVWLNAWLLQSDMMKCFALTLWHDEMFGSHSLTWWNVWLSVYHDRMFGSHNLPWWNKCLALTVWHECLTLTVWRDEMFGFYSLAWVNQSDWMFGSHSWDTIESFCCIVSRWTW